MPVFLAPVAAMGYMYWKKRRNGLDGGNGEDKREPEGPSDDGNEDIKESHDDNMTASSEDNNSAVEESPTSSDSISLSSCDGEKKQVSSSTEKRLSSTSKPTSDNSRTGPFGGLKRFFQDGLSDDDEQFTPPKYNINSNDGDGQKYIYVKGQKIAMPKISYK